MGTTRRRFLQSFGLSKNISPEPYSPQIESYLETAPWEYLIWDQQNIVSHSQGFLKLFECNDIQDMSGFYKYIDEESQSDFSDKLKSFLQSGQSRELAVTTLSGKKIRLTLRKTQSELRGDTSSHANILWAEDITDIFEENKDLKKQAEGYEERYIQYQEALQSVSTPICIYKKDGDIHWCNQAYAELFKSDIDTVINSQKTLSFKSIAEKKKIDVSDEVQKAMQSDSPITHEVTSVIAGERYRFELIIKPVKETDFAIVSVNDKTFEETISADTKRTESGYNALLENLQTAVSLFNSDQQIIFYNSAFTKLWHLDESWLNQKPQLGDILEKLRETRRLPEQADFRSYKHEWLARFTNLLAPQTDMIVLPDGTVLRSQTIPNPAGGLMLIFEDVTTNLELESSYNTLIAVQSETLNNLNEGVVVFGGDGRLKLWNPTYAELWDFHPEDLEEGMHISKMAEKTKHFYTKDIWEERYKNLLKTIEARKADSGIVKRKDNKTIAYSFVPLPDGGSMFTYANITDTVNVEEALREKNRALETAEKLKSEFLENVSYQLRTPLNAIIGFNEILAAEFFGDLNEKQKEYTRDIHEAGSRLKQLIDDVLDLTSIEAGKLALEKIDTDVCELLHSVKSVGEEWANSKQLKFIVNCDEKIGELHADPQRLKQVLMHLLRNAISYTDEKGQITLSATREEGFLKILMEDTGIGMSAEEQEKMFEPFVIGTGKQYEVAETGAGLGLTLVRNIITLHKGLVAIDSVKGEGTKITLSFPEKA